MTLLSIRCNDVRSRLLLATEITLKERNKANKERPIEKLLKYIQLPLYTSPPISYQLITSVVYLPNDIFYSSL